MKIRGIYVSPSAVVRSPEYTQALTDRGVNLCILRAGFDASRSDPDLNRACDMLAKQSVSYWFLLGTWWGHGVQHLPDPMRPLVKAPYKYSEVEAHESQWSMTAPGGAMDETISSAIKELISRYQPEGICLTHARYKHIADMYGLFETADSAWFLERLQSWGIELEELEQAVKQFSSGVIKCDAKQFVFSIKEIREQMDPSENGLYYFFDHMAGQRTVLKGWLDFRVSLVSKSIKRFSDIAKTTRLRYFGTNAMHPQAALLCGEDYERLREYCDFIQPLLGYSFWHIFHSVGNWARFFHQSVTGLSTQRALRETCRLMGYPEQVFLSKSPGELFSEDIVEHSDVKCLVEQQFQRSLQLAGDKTLPVIRGRKIDPTLIQELEDLILRDKQSMGIVYQGTERIAGEPPSDGWY